jgi:hypothetical protein
VRKKALDTVIKAFLDLSQREYTCSEISECLERFTEDLNKILVRKTKYYCFVEFYTDTKLISVVCGLDMIYVYVDIDNHRIKPLIFKVRGL